MPRARPAPTRAKSRVRSDRTSRPPDATEHAPLPNRPALVRTRDATAAPLQQRRRRTQATHARREPAAGPSIDGRDRDLYARGVTDGLPGRSAHPSAVERAIAASGRAADELIALVPPNYGRATVEKIAINAVMAGCRPEYLPVVHRRGGGGVRRGLRPARRVGDDQRAGAAGDRQRPDPRDRSTSTRAPGVFGPGWRANATIGRALRLVCVNLGGATPGRGQHVHARPSRPLHVLHRRARGGEPVGVARGRARLRADRRARWRCSPPTRR